MHRQRGRIRDKGLAELKILQLAFRGKVVSQDSSEAFKILQKRIPERIIEKAVKGMLPKGTLGRKMYTRLKVTQGSQHFHKAQKPELINFK